ncbi:hypothetical protein [Methylocystis sp.]
MSLLIGEYSALLNDAIQPPPAATISEKGDRTLSDRPLRQLFMRLR